MRRKSKRGSGPFAVAREFRPQLSAEEEDEYANAVTESISLMAAGRDWRDKTLPVNAIFVRWEIQEQKAKFESGRRRALLTAIRICAAEGLPLPDWARDAFIEAYDHVSTGHANSWDEAFGVPYPGKQLSARRKKVQHSFALYYQAVQLHRAGAAIDEGLFEAVGKLHGVRKSTAAAWYYEHEKKLGLSRALDSTLAASALDPELREILLSISGRADRSSKKSR